MLDFVGVELRKLSNCSPSQVGHQDVEHLSYRSEGLGERLLVVEVVLWYIIRIWYHEYGPRLFISRLPYYMAVQLKLALFLVR